MKYYYKKNVSIHEYKMHQLISNLNIVKTPKIYNYDKKTKILKLQYLNELDISNKYGDNINNVHSDYINQIRHIILKLYQYGIIYNDITGYNFIEKKENVWIIDFEHCQYLPKKCSKFVEEFIDGKNNWNPLFK